MNKYIAGLVLTLFLCALSVYAKFETMSGIPLKDRIAVAQHVLRGTAVHFNIKSSCTICIDGSYYWTAAKTQGIATYGLVYGALGDGIVWRE